ncbi:ATP-binding cassette sub-family B member 8, mitochondrial [Liparis tanakae]|uniref:Mitochondrial potassium channel ATP-binding subunit n=1 Tax=Liparis tanakae TaxID=230148 RepID=A0A4Z2GP23_9TELE|nr:ATP-binding cassette sub-family B member 8, mitochondrial [Liparis tanakae]
MHSGWYTSPRSPAYSSTQQPGNAVSRIWSFTQRAVRRPATRTSKPPGVALKFILGPAVLTVSARLFCPVARCEADVNNNIPLGVAAKTPEPPFKWHILWEFVKPQLYALMGAVVLAFGAALLNIQIPLMLGELVNVVARYLREQTGSYVHEIRGPAMKLLGLYGIQGLLTSGYIILLSKVGERVAADMRKTLFASLLRQDVAFFDSNKTGHLVNRLTADIQEFKSSFKLVSKATGVADEALGNVRTVKAFAMEERELQLYAYEVDKSCDMNENLGSGIAVFQGLSNVALNYCSEVIGQYLCPFWTGKSTVASLLERFYDPTGGAVLLDGLDIRTLDLSWLRGQVIGYINQEPVLFGSSITDNIRFGNPEATDAEVINAAKQANAHGFITGFPDGYNTVVGERGATLSGGQKQRIAIARALVKNPRILVLDEATSALDAESERVVQEALDRATSGRTVLIIAHRLSTIQGADLICVMSNGRIVEAGTHLELLSKGGIYSDLIRRQRAEGKK